MKWVIVSEKYLNYLRNKYDNRIPYTNYGENKFKPFFGELFKINEYSYITQITSYKPRLDKIKEGKDFYKIYKNNKLIACINLNYMFPVLTKDLYYIKNYNDIDKFRQFNSLKEKSNYITLLKYELEEINKKPITISAKYLYKNKYEKPNNNLSKRCLDYKNLEKGCKEYDILIKTQIYENQKEIKNKILKIE